MTAQSTPFPTPIKRQDAGDRHVFSWSCDNPPLHGRYRLEWNFRRPPTTSDGPQPRPSEVMKALGVVQRGDPILRRPARQFQLPTEADEARRIIAELNAAAERIVRVHTFGKGMGIAAPQIGIDRAAAIIRTPEDQAITLLNPTIVDSSPDTDEHYEGCLSFFDVRGQAIRARTIHVQHTDLDGTTKITVFERGLARLVSHEVDHLHGILYTDRMRPGVHTIPIEQYRDIGAAWKY